MTLQDPAFSPARQVIRHGLESRAFPAAVVNVGRARGVLWQEAFGRLSYADDEQPTSVETIFDLASLTKVIATASVAMRQIESGQLALDTPVADVIRPFRAESRARVTVRHLLEHSSGLPAHARLWELASGRDAYETALCALPLEREPGTAAVYSDPGFMLLGLLLERIGNRTLDLLVDEVLGPWPAPLLYRPPERLSERIAPTEQDPWRGHLLRGEVHDENAAALGGVAGHAGLFGTAEAVAAYARLVLQTLSASTRLGTPALMRTFVTRSAVPGSSRALAWDTALATSSCGTRMSPSAIGHTGFTGTSLWIDPERDVYAVLLTNRVHPTRQNEALLPLRARFHDALPF